MAYKTFANGFPLPASDLNNYLMNQSVIVFADSTARTAALPTPTEGMVTYLEDTNNYQYWDSAAWVDLVEAPDLSTLIPKSTVTTAGDLIVADGASSVTRLGVGADDQVLTLVSGAPAWADAGGGGGGITLLSTTSLAGSGFLSISGISQDYTDLRIVLDQFYTGLNDTDIIIATKSSGSYVDGKFIFSIDNGSSAITFSRSGYPALGKASNSSTQKGSSIITINNYSSTTLRKQIDFYGNAQGSNSRIAMGSGALHTNTNAIDELEIILQLSTTFTGGTAYLYGVN